MSYETNVGFFPVPDVYMAKVGTPPPNEEWGKEWTKIPSGTDEIKVEFNMVDTKITNWVRSVMEVKRLRESMAKVARDIRRESSQAGVFDREVKRLHRIPDDADTWKRLRVRRVVHSYNEMGYYKINYVSFEDGSVYYPD